MNTITPIAFFDLDGTITRIGTYSPFLLSCPIPEWKKALAIPAILGAMVAYKAGLMSRKRLKEFMLARTIAGTPRATVQVWSDRFVGGVMETGLLPGALRRLDWHREQGHDIVLATASPDIVARNLANRLEIDKIVCTKTSWDDKDRLRAQLDGENCYGKNKIQAIRAAGFGFDAPDTRPEIYAYSDSHADLPLLTWADHPFAVNPSRKLRAAARQYNIPVKDWR